MDANRNPVLVEVRRGGVVESWHRGSAVAVDAGGGVRLQLGDVAKPVYPRSALKMFQAIPLVASGAADAYQVSDAELALACGSHNGEPCHTDTLRRWLRRLGLGADDLACGADSPLSKPAALALAAAGTPPTRTHHNCSGKHAGMLTVATHLGATTAGYDDHDHPAQRGWMDALGGLIGVAVGELPWERDGCGLPAICMPLEYLARAFACVGGGGGDGVGAALARITAAIFAHPHMVAGEGRCCTEVLRAASGEVLVKTGAEGVYGGVLLRRGIGFALKIDDGATRASEVALGALLAKLGAPDAAATTKLAAHFRPPIINSQGYTTGQIVPSAAWDEIEVNTIEGKVINAIEDKAVNTKRDEVINKTKQILECLNKVEIRCTYEAVAGVLGIHRLGVGRLLGDRRPEASWVVQKDTELPSGYKKSEMHPRLCCNQKIIKTADELKALCHQHPQRSTK